MRVLHVVPTYLPATRYGGTIFAVHNLCAALVRTGCEVTVFTTNVDGPGESPVSLGEPVVRDGVKVRYFVSRYLRRLYYSPDMGAELQRIAGRYDVLHLHSVFLWPTWRAAREARRARIPYLLAPRGMLVKELIARKNPLLKRLWIELVERGNLRHAAGIHATSGVESRELRKFGWALPALYEVPNGVGIDAHGTDSGELPGSVAEILDRRAPAVLFLGRVNWKKGLDRLIPAMKLVPQANLLIVGNDEDGYSEKLAEMIRAGGLGDRVRICGAVYGLAKRKLLERAAVLVLPSYSENFGNVVLEAMLEGCPVVVTPGVGAADIVIACGGGIVTESDPPSLARSIGRLIDDPELRREMGRKGQAEMQRHFSWDRIATQMMSVYRRVVSSGAVAP